MKNFLGLFLVILFPLFLTSCFSYKEIELGDVKNVKLNKAKNGDAEIVVGLMVNNPNNYKIKVKRIDADMLVNGKKVGKLALTKKVVLPKKTEDVQSFAVNTQLTNLLSALPSIFFGGEVKLQLKGQIKGKVFMFSKTFPIEAEKNISAKDLNLF